MVRAREKERVADFIIGGMPDRVEIFVFGFIDDQAAGAQREVMLEDAVDLVRPRDDSEPAKLKRAIADRRPASQRIPTALEVHVVLMRRRGVLGVFGNQIRAIFCGCGMMGPPRIVATMSVTSVQWAERWKFSNL